MPIGYILLYFVLNRYKTVNKDVKYVYKFILIKINFKIVTFYLFYILFVNHK